MIKLESKATTQADMESDWVAYWCSRLGVPITYHRKIWEYCFLLEVLRINQIMSYDRGLGFACGTEPIPSLLASRGVYITATDLSSDSDTSKIWMCTNQHATSIDNLWYPQFLTRDKFNEMVSFQYVDMNNIPSSLTDYDFCWSICAAEHLGSIDNGLNFIENSLNTLRPGGIAIHTIEYNTDNNGPTLDNCTPTVVFQRKHIESLVNRLRKEGHWVAPLNFDVGDGPYDKYVDTPPRTFEEANAKDHPIHLKLYIESLVCTCFGLIVKKYSGHIDL